MIFEMLSGTHSPAHASNIKWIYLYLLLYALQDVPLFMTATEERWWRYCIWAICVTKVSLFPCVCSRCFGTYCTKNWEFRLDSFYALCRYSFVCEFSKSSSLFPSPQANLSPQAQGLSTHFFIPIWCSVNIFLLSTVVFRFDSRPTTTGSICAFWGMAVSTTGDRSGKHTHTFLFPLTPFLLRYPFAKFLSPFSSRHC